jgi:enamine deaminase RidA (YjgF/YER057c/UK114 family)
MADPATERLAALGIDLPPPPKPAGMYVPAVRTGNLVYCSGAGPTRPDGTHIVGTVGGDLTLEEGRAAARMGGAILLASLSTVVALDDVTRVVKILGMVSPAPGFTNTPAVIDGCSELFIEVFGEAGRGARSAVGMAALPFGICVEIEAIFEVRA